MLSAIAELILSWAKRARLVLLTLKKLPMAKSLLNFSLVVKDETPETETKSKSLNVRMKAEERETTLLDISMDVKMDKQFSDSLERDSYHILRMIYLQVRQQKRRRPFRPMPFPIEEN